ncbi:MAG: hypothetical protein ALECFALPRED_009176 [Alectoria fallacina]|uniref:F-box domain-containing protein n=1 Tax=Alectoria fallacina TaxID=1903189 RepID=A0A8H3J6Q1_9LECA|nr:MAG: hypothetical protein ALECFALPRED_009176 [Alectoria fallacina]
MGQTTCRTRINGDSTSMAKSHYSQVMRWTPPPLQDTVSMPWNLDRFHGKNTKLPKNIFWRLETRPNPTFPSRLFTMPLDILEHLLDRMTKRDAFQLSQTCKNFMWHPIVLKAIFSEPISIAEIGKWYRHLPDCGMNTKMMVGPPVTWGINASTGPLVRRLAVPEWISEQDIRDLIANCPNLHALDFTEFFESVPHPLGWESEEDSDEDSDDDEEQGDLEYWPSMLDRCPDLFANLRSIHLPYGCWRTVYSRLHSYQQTHTACLPKLLHLAKHLQSLELSCQQEPKIDPSPETRRKVSAKLLAEILDNVSRGLTTLALYYSESTIDNIESFLQPLSVFPNLRTIKLSLHRDLLMYERDSQFRYGFNSIIAPILFSPTRYYEHDTASVLQYLSTIKKINDRGRFSLVSSDCGEDYHSTLRDYYGLCHTELIHGPRDDIWTPVWTWNDRLDWIKGDPNHPAVEVLEVGKCRALFKELTKSRIPVSVVLEPLTVPFGAFFASPWDEGVSHGRHGGSENAGTVLNGCSQSLSGNGAMTPSTRDLGRQPKQHFIQRRVLTTITLKHPSPSHSIPTQLDDQRQRTVSVDLAAVEDKPSYSDYKDSLGFRSLVLAAWVSQKQKSLQRKQRGNAAKSNPKPFIIPAAPDIVDAKSEIPDPIWRLNEIGDLVDDLRLIWHRSFAYVYTKLSFEHCDPNPDWTEWSKRMHKCKMHLRGRLWREAEHTALLLRRIPIDFPRLTRLALYIPTGLYPHHDQTFINHALPGTGWTVKHCGSVGGVPPTPSLDGACLKLADDICPFIRRVFTRPTPTDDPSAVIVHDEEWHRTKRPLFDLDGEYKSMEQLLTEPLPENYTKGND